MRDPMSSPRSSATPRSAFSPSPLTTSLPRKRQLRLLLFLFLSSLVSTSLASPQFLRGTTPKSKNNETLVQDHPVVYPPSYALSNDHHHGGLFKNTTNLQETHRRNLASGRRTVLIIRVIAGGRSPSPTASSLISHIFTHPHSLANQMKLCSANTLTLVPASYGSGGVVDVQIRASSSDVRAMIAESQQVAPNFIPGVSNLYGAADHVMFVFPQTSNYVAEAEIAGRYSWYNNGLAESMSVIMHEIGHNFGLDHAGITSDEYGDYSANMGRSVSSKLSPRMCFNAANNWQMGWYGNARQTISSINAPIRISLSAFVDYPSVSNTVLVKILTNSYLQFNGRSKHNDGTRANANQVVIIRQESSRRTTLLAGLSSGQTYRGSGYVVQVCSINGSSGAEISIGRTTTSCSGPSSSSFPAPRPTPSSFSWPTPARSPTTPWFPTPIWPAPSPPSSPSFSFGFAPSPPTFNFGFSSPTPPSPFRFTPTPPSPFGFAPSPPTGFRPSTPTFSSTSSNPWNTAWASIFGSSDENGTT